MSERNPALAVLGIESSGVDHGCELAADPFCHDPFEEVECRRARRLVALIDSGHATKGV